MSGLDKLSLALLFGLIFLAILSYLPAWNSYHWFLRVGVPEMGVGFLLLALPAALVIARNSPKVATGLSAVLLTLTLAPWIQALGVQRTLSKEWSFAHKQARNPLALGERGTHTEATEEYKEGLQWDRYTPSNAEAKARLLFVHGGSWRNGTRKDYPQLFRYLADRGVEVLSLTYTLSGTAPYPAAILDIESAIDKAYGDGSLPLLLAGRSSGGHCALLSAYRNPDKVSGVVGFYPPVDMKWSYDNPSNPNVLDSQEAIVEFMEAAPLEAMERYKEASPIHRATEDTPPTLLIHGGADCLVFPRQSEMLSERLRELGVDYHHLYLPWMEHGGDITIYGPTGRLSTWAVESFLDSIVQRQES